VTYAPHAQDVPGTAGLVDSIARLIAELAEVRVVSDRRADRVAELERENGRLSAELAAARTPQSLQAGSTGPLAPAPAVDSPSPGWRAWWPILAVLLVLIAAWTGALVVR